MEKGKLRRAQSNMMAVAGIAIGIELTKSGEIDQAKSFFENAVNLFSGFDDEFLKDMVRSLQDYINEQEEN